MRDSRSFVLTGGTLAVFTIRDLRRYRCAANRWQFRWFEFESVGRMRLPLNTPMEMERGSEEDLDYQRLLTVMPQANSGPLLATAYFGVLYHRWVADYRKGKHPNPHQQKIDQVIQRMQECSQGNLSVNDMAQIAGLCERRFRDVFREITGLSPKKFYDKLRLESAQQMLRFTSMPIAHIAGKLGFSSPFHLSRVYRQMHGYPPSRERSGPPRASADP